jgi:polysaccharide chain length determinant protein (PEP-CTERM system associated)
MAHDVRTEAKSPKFGAIWNRRKRLAIAVFAGALGISLGAVKALPPIYRARATVLVDREQVPEAFVRSAVSSEVETRLSTISQEVLSRERLQALIERFDLYAGMRKSGMTEGALEEMRRDIGVEPRIVEQGGGRATTIAVTISFRNGDRQKAADVANALAALYVERNTKIRERQATGTAGFLKAQLTDMKAKLDEQERRVGQPPLPVEAEVAALERLNMRLRVVSDRQLRAMDRRERLVKEMGGDAAAEPGAAPDSAIARLAKLKADLAELKAHYTDKYPDVIKLRADIASLEQRIASSPPEPAPAPAPSPAARSSKGPLAEVDAELKALKDEEQTLQAQLANSERRAEDSPRRITEFERQTRDYAASKDFYASLLKRYEDAQIAESMEQGQRSEQFRVLDPAVPPKDPVAPIKPRLALIALGLSLGLGGLAVLLAERLDVSFHTMDDLRNFSRVPVIVGIPALVTARDVTLSRRRFGLFTAVYAVGLTLAVGVSYLAARGNEPLTRLLSGG